MLREGDKVYILLSSIRRLREYENDKTIEAYFVKYISTINKDFYIKFYENIFEFTMAINESDLISRLEEEYEREL